ncbi:hypothetical protein HZS_1247 [Henneguya salminicola]|nr:hypothetical protein HZS_1247 [Henneguya salminicola]
MTPFAYNSGIYSCFLLTLIERLKSKRMNNAIQIMINCRFDETVENMFSEGKKHVKRGNKNNEI